MHASQVAYGVGHRRQIDWLFRIRVLLGRLVQAISRRPRRRELNVEVGGESVAGRAAEWVARRAQDRAPLLQLGRLRWASNAAHMQRALTDRQRATANAQGRLKMVAQEPSPYSIPLDSKSICAAQGFSNALTCMILNTEAAVRWLDRPQPNVAEALRALRDIRKSELIAATVSKALSE